MAQLQNRMPNFWTRCTVSAQGGITCAIASADPNDDWRWHMYDTVKGSDCRRPRCDRVHVLSRTGSGFELEHRLLFSRFENGRIYQRFGGQSKDYGEGGHGRTCAAADNSRTVTYAVLANLKNKTTFLNEWFAVDLPVTKTVLLSA